jgi:MFS family permease
MAEAGAPSTTARLADDGSLAGVRPAFVFGFFNATTWQVALGTPMVLFAERLGASTAAVGLAYSFVFLLTPIQVLSTSLLPRFGFKRMMLSGWGTRSLFLLPPLALALIAPETGTTTHVVVFIGSVFMFTLFRSIGACAWLPWMNSLLTTANRGRYFSIEQVASGVAGVGTLLLCWLTLEVLPLYVAFALQYAFAFVGSWLAYIALSRLPDAEKPSALALGEVIAESPRLVLRPGVFRQFLLICVTTGVAVTAIPPFCAYYLKVGPGLSASQILSFTTMQYAGVIAGAFLIRNQVDRVGARPFIQAAMLVYCAIAAFWIAQLRGFATATWMFGVVYFCIGIAASCWQSGVNKYLPLVVDPGRRTLAFSVHGAVTSVVSGISPAVWGLFIKGDGATTSVDARAFQVFFLVALVGSLIVAGLVSRLPSAAGVGGGAVFGGVLLRPFRGLTYLASIVLPRHDDSPPSQRDRR